MMDKTDRLMRKMEIQELIVRPEVRTPITGEMYIPNHSGDHSAGIVNTTPTATTDIVNKAYVDNMGSFAGPVTITADNSSADVAYVPMVLYNTDATPPAANTVPIGTIYIQYTA